MEKKNLVRILGFASMALLLGGGIALSIPYDQAMGSLNEATGVVNGTKGQIKEKQNDLADISDSKKEKSTKISDLQKELEAETDESKKAAIQSQIDSLNAEISELDARAVSINTEVDALTVTLSAQTSVETEKANIAAEKAVPFLVPGIILGAVAVGGSIAIYKISKEVY